MSEMKPESEEQLFSSARAALEATLSPADGQSSIPASDGPPAAPNSFNLRAWIRGRSLLYLAAALSLVGWMFPRTLGGARGWSMLLLLCVIFRYIRKQSKALQEAAKLNRPVDPRTVMGGQAGFFTSAVVALSVGIIIFPPAEAVWYFATILLHETGHYLAMRFFSYRNLRMSFTYLGGITTGENENLLPWQDAIILLMGPLPGLVIGCSLYFLNLPAHSAFLQIGASWLVTLNFINLMPVGSLDGEKLLNVLLFGRSSAFARKILVPAVFGLIYLLSDHTWRSFALVAIGIVLLVPTSYRIAAAADALYSRWGNLPPNMRDLSENQWRDLFEETRTRFSKTRLSQWMGTVHGYLLVRRAPLNVAIAFGGVYLAVVSFAVICASATQLRADAGPWPVLPTLKLEKLNLQHP